MSASSIGQYESAALSDGATGLGRVFPAGANRTVSLDCESRKPSLPQRNANHQVFLDLSKEEQRKRFLERIDEPDKNWKFSLGDIMKVYETCVSATSTKVAPWYVVPADDKENARLIISEIILDVFNGLKMAYPKAGAKRRRELHLIRQRLVK